MGQNITPYMLQRRAFIESGRPLKKTTPHHIAKKSEKRKAKEKELAGDVSMQRWFEERRPELVGTCQCGCAEPSQKNDDQYYKHSICHLFPKAKFESIYNHPLNYVERAFWGGCHSVMDDTSLDRWPAMADWLDIREKFFVLEPLLSREEKATKFYKALKRLVEENPI